MPNPLERGQAADEILGLAGSTTDAQALASVALEKLLEWTGCQAGGIRLRDGDDFPFVTTQGMPACLVNPERSLLRIGEDGRPVRESDGSAALDCTCGIIARGDYDPEQPFFTQGGSFWTANAESVADSFVSSRWGAHIRGRCVGEGYRSFGLVPIRSDDGIIGVAHLCDKRTGVFDLAVIATVEQAMEGLGPALAHRLEMEALRDVKAQYQALFDNMMEGFSYCQMYYDKEGRPVDWGYLAVNDALCELSGLEDLVGRRINEIIPGFTERAPELLEAYGRVASGRKTERLEFYYFPQDKWLEIVAFSPQQGRFVAVFNDITERRRTEETLRRVHYSIDHATDSVLWLNEAGAIVDASESTCRRLEYDREELIGRPIFDIDPLLPAETWPEHWQRVKREGALIFESVHRTKSGKILREEITANYVNFDGLEYICSFSHDIGRRKDLEESLQLVRFSVDHAADSIIWTDVSGTILEVSESACRNLEYTREELISLSIFDVDPSFSSIDHAEHWRSLKEQGVLTFESSHTTKSGTSYPVEVTSNFMVYQGKECSCSFSHDISKRKQSERELRSSLELLGKVFQATPVGVVLTRLTDYTLRDVNPAFEEISGYSKQETVGRTTLDLGLVDPKEWATLSRDLAGTGRVHGRQLTARHRSGDQREVVFYAEPIDLDGERCVLTFIHDITERVRSEQKVHEQQEQLRQSQKMEAVGQLAGGIAHDFNNVLTSILGLSDLILSSPDVPEEMIQDVRDIRAAAGRAGTLTRQILAFSRRQALNPEVTSLNEVLTGLDRMLGRTLGEHIRLATLFTPDLGLVEVDVGQLEQVLLNLALNARDAMPEGGTLTLETANVELDEETSRDHADLRPGPHVMLAVSDTGVGMDKSTMSRIFEPFYTTKPAGKGTGLGLSTVYGVVKQSGGAVTVYSEPGRGTTFKIYLPRVDRHSATGEASSEGSEPKQGSESILLVEDEPQVRSLVTRVLSALGYQVTATATGPEALDMVDTGRPFDLLLTDLILPGEFQGHQVAELVSRSRPGLPILYMSGYTRDSIVHAGRLDEGVNFLAKPFTTEALAERVREVLEQGNLGRGGPGRGKSGRRGRGSERP